MKINIETNPIKYKFIIEVGIQSIEKNGEEYLKKLMYHYFEYDFKIINGSYKRDSKSHDRLGKFNPYHWDIIKVTLNLERDVEDIHSPSDYIDNQLRKEIYEIFDSFRTNIVTNDDKLDYVYWIGVSWIETNK